MENSMLVNGTLKYPIILLTMLVITGLAFSQAEAASIKDLAQLEGVRDNQLIGMGLVSGLPGTGDDVKSSPQAGEALGNLMSHFGFQIDPQLIKSKNFAAVMLTATLPAYANPGDRLDVEVSTIGNAKNLEGGMLLMTELRGADTFYGSQEGNAPIYALAQGSISSGSVNRSGRSAILTKGSIPGGALVERSVNSTVSADGNRLHYNLREPDFTTAARIAMAINQDFNSAGFGSNARIATAVDKGKVEVLIPLEARLSLVDFIARIEQLQVTPDSIARIVIDQNTGTIAMGGSVRIRPVHISHGSMSFSFGNGLIEAGTSTVSDPSEAVAADAVGNMLLPSSDTGDAVSETTAADVAAGLNKLKLSAEDIVEIFLQIHRVGAMDAELVLF
jgi:flagellar P-ring protein precursor FlgI